MSNNSITTTSKRTEISKIKYCSAFRGWVVFAPSRDKDGISRPISRDNIARKL